MRKTLFPAIAALLAAGISVPAAAETVTIAVSTADLDLTLDAHVSELEERVAAAAREACNRTSSFSVFGQAAERSCREELIEKAALEIAERRAAAIARAQTRELALID